MLRILWLVVSVMAYETAQFRQTNFEFGPNFQNISKDCASDMRKWMAGIKKFELDVALCATKGSNCSRNIKDDLKYNLYAIKQLDSFGKFPAAVLDITLVSDGSYSECMEVGSHYAYKTNYCYMSKTLEKGNTCDKNLFLKSAVCMPESCTAKDLVNLFNRADKFLYTYCSSSCVPNHVETDTFFWIFMGFLMFLGLWAILATVVDYVLETYYCTESKNAKNPFLRILLSFSLYTNVSAIMDTTPAKDGHINCIRFLSMMWVACGHCQARWMETNTLQPLFSIFKPLLADLVLNAFFAVDTFFLLSGLLVSYMFFKMNPSKSMVKNPMTWILYYVHRYLRLTPPYILFLGFVIAVAPFMIGPQTAFLPNDNMQVVADVCKKYWWQNILYINNFNIPHMCFGVAWYLTADMQMYLVAPIFLCALYISHIAGAIAIGGAIIGSVTANYVLTYKYNLPGTRTALSPESSKFGEYLYAQPWIRCTPYLIGIYVGYLLARYRNRKIILHPLLCILGWGIFTAMALGCIFGPDQYISYKTQWNKFQSATYYAWSRVGWALSVSWVIAANHRGWGGYTGDPETWDTSDL